MEIALTGITTSTDAPVLVSTRTFLPVMGSKVGLTVTRLFGFIPNGPVFRGNEILNQEKNVALRLATAPAIVDW
jgi:hypothetical protein